MQELFYIFRLEGGHQAEKLNTVVPMADPQSIGEICRLAEDLDQFEFTPVVQTPEEYGKYMIRGSGHFEYDENLEGFYDCHHCEEQHVQEEGGQFNECGYVAYHGILRLEKLMREDPAEQAQQMGGWPKKCRPASVLIGVHSPSGCCPLCASHLHSVKSIFENVALKDESSGLQA